jgi:RNA polymerase sigma-70 factor, ECF subfamily
MRAARGEGAMSNDDDTTLVERAQQGAGDAFGLLVQRYQDRVYRLVRRIVGDSEAEDALQETFLSAWRALPRFKGDAAFSTWIYRIATNAALMRLRKRRPDVVSLDAPLRDAEGGETAAAQEIRDWSATPDEDLINDETRAAMEKAIGELPDDWRVAFMLRDVEEMSNADAAATLDLSVPAFKARVHRARLFLRDRLDRHFGTTSRSA